MAKENNTVWLHIQRENSKGKSNLGEPFDGNPYTNKEGVEVTPKLQKVTTGLLIDDKPYTGDFIVQERSITPAVRMDGTEIETAVRIPLDADVEKKVKLHHIDNSKDPKEWETTEISMSGKEIAEAHEKFAEMKKENYLSKKEEREASVEEEKSDDMEL